MNETINCPHCGSSNTFFSKKNLVHICEDCKYEFKPEKLFIPLRIFISYGRDEYAKLAEKLKADLQARGHEVWFDKDRLQEGGDWEHYIDEGLNWVSKDQATGRVLFIMTPHSVRRPDGYCLNEIAKALTKSVPIIPVMLVYSEPPLSIYRLQYLDMQDCFPPNEKVISYEKRLERLILALEEKKLDFEGVQGRLLKTLEPISFAADISKLLKDFTGRKWVFDQIDSWLSNPDGSKIFWLQGAPGIGKSAIAAWLRDNRREIAAFHFCDYRSEEKRNPFKLVRSIAYQLSTQLPAYEERLKSLGLEEIIQEYSEAYTLFDKLIVQPLAENFPKPDRTITILIDALDEATYQKRNEIALFLSRCMDKTPSWMRFLITSRPEQEIISSLQSLSPCILDTTTNENRLDLLEYLKKRLPQITNDQADTVLKKSEGVFLYVCYVCDEVIAHKRLSLDRLHEFPQGLGDVYFQFFDRQFSKDQNYYEKEIRPLLCAVLAADEPLRLGLLLDVLGYRNRMELFDRLDRLGSLFPRTGGEDEDTISTFHRSLADWITVKDRAGAYYIDVEYGHRMLADYGWRTYETGPESMVPYFLAWLPCHLAQICEYARLVLLLKDFLYMMSRLKAEILERLLEDYRDLVKEIPGEFQNDLRHEAAFYRERAHVLRRGKEDWPTYKILLQLAIEHADDSPLTIGAEKFLAEGKCEWVWLRRERRLAHAGIDQCIAVFEGHTDEITGTLLISGERILTWSPDKTLRLWDNDGKQLGMLEGHTDHINGALLMPSGRILSWSADKTLRLWASDGKPLNILEGHTSNVKGALLIPNGQILSWSSDETLRLWDDDGKPCAVLRGHKVNVKGALLIHDGRILSWSGDKTLRLWDGDGKHLATLEGHTDSIWGALLTPDGRILSWSADNALRLWDGDGKPTATLEGHTRQVHGTLLVPAGRILSWSEDKTLRLWDSDGNPLVTLKGHMGSIHGALLMPDGRILSWSADKTLRLWDSDGNPLVTLEGHTGNVSGAQLMPNGRILSWSWDGTLRLWAVDGKPTANLAGHTRHVHGALVMPDERILSWSDDGTARLWNTDEKALIDYDRHRAKIDGTLLMSNGRILSWSADKTLRLWDSDGNPLVTLKGHMGSIRGALLIPDGRILSWSADKTLRLWDSDGNPLVTLKGHMGSIKGALLIHDGRILSWSGDKTLRLWDVGGKPLATLEGHTTQINGVLLMPNGRILSWSWDGTLRLWDIDGKPLATLLGHTIMLNGVLLTPDGRILSWSGDKTLRLWDVDGKPIATLEGHTGQVRGVLLTPDGRILSWSGDKTLRLWDSDGNCLGSLEGHTCESKGVLLIPDGQILSWADDGTIFLWSYDGEPLAIQVVQDIRGALLLSDGEILLWSDDRRVHLWDIHRNRFSVYSQIQSFNLFPEVRSKYFSEACICSRSIIDKKRCLLCLDVYGHDSIISICWNSLVYCKQKLLKHEGLVIATQENGQVCFLRTYNGDHRISLEEVEHSVTKTKELLLRDAISTLTSCGNEQNDKHETNLPVQYSQFNEKGTIAAIMEGRLTPDEGLRWAIRKGYKEIVSLALSKGADLCKEIGGSLPAEYARQKDKIDMIKALIPDSLPQDAALRFRFAEIQHFYHSARDNHDSRLKFCRDMESIALELQQKTGKIHKLLYAYNSMIVSSMVIDDFDLCAIYLDKSDLIDPEAQYGNHACLSARLGKTDEAFEWLAKYVAKKQEPDFEWMQKDPDLESIRTDPRWVSKLKAWNSQKTNDLVTATRANVISKIAELIYYSDLKDSERILWGAFLKKVNAEECIAVYDAVSASEENLYLLTKHLHSKIIEMRRNT